MTLTDVLVRAAAEAPDRGVVHVGGDGTERFTSYAGLYADALRVAGGLRAAGLRKGDPMLLVAEDSAEFLPLFWGAVVAGVVPVPLPDEPARLAAVRRVLGQLPRLSLAELPEAAPLAAPEPVGPDDLALLQFSSGSTGTPKGVELTHGNLAANVEQAARASAAGPDDVVVTWMPYFHDMGLIGTHLTPLHLRCAQVRISPLTFAKRPETWLRVAARHRATILSAANFALAMTVRRVPDAVLDGLDLSSVRLVMVGAEPISPAVWRAFAGKLSRARLDPGALQPVYGLAEATVAVSCPPMGELARPHRLSRAALARGVAVDAGPDAPAVELMDVGHPVPDCEIRVTDDSGVPLEDGLVGHIQVRGPNVTRGYHRDPAATAAALVDGWLRTGDLGFLRAGRLCVTGRHKDVLFVHGRTFHAADLEEVAAATPGLGTGPVAVVGATGAESGRERVVVFLAAPAVRADPSVAGRVRGRVAEALGYDGVEVQVVPSGAFQRTTSGKLRRQPLRERIGVPAPAEATPAPSDAMPAGPPRTRPEMERAVRAVWARVLRIPAERIGPGDRFLAIGGSSLAAMEVLAALEDAFGRTLDPVLLRDCATVPALADRLLSLSDAPAAPAENRKNATDELAVIGLACRFPDADSPEQFWRNLLAGHDSVTPVTRWTGGGHGAFLTDPGLFDAGYFGIGDDEARWLDPHARIFLELAHEALERAGYAGPRRHGRRIGVFAAVGESGYPELMAQSGATGTHALTGTLRNLTAARVAHLLDLRGPALAIDTACSSALVALHLAGRSLAAGDCDMAVVGGVSLNLTGTAERLLAGAQALSPTGRCRAFDADADGFVPGEGGAVLVLTRAGDAGGDDILALVRGTAVNNDGRSLSLMAPNPLVQQEVIVSAYRDSGVDPADVSYVEAHGTGTAVGDPIEARSLAYAFPPLPDGRRRLLGSVKTNIGHLLNVAGMPGLLKVILALRHRELPPSLHHERPTPRFDLAGAGFEVVTERRPWTGPLVAGVNSFGFGGTNAHAILAAPPVRDPEPSPAVTGPHLLTLSARSGAALRAAAADLVEHLREHPGLREGDVCATASTARDDGPYRVALTVDGDLADQLAAIIPGPPIGRTPRVAFLFSGSSGFSGAALYATAPVFRAVLDEVSDAIGPIAGRTLAAWCIGPAILAAEVARPLAVAVAAAQAAQLRAFGVRPDAVTGHGAGELAAAVSTGMLTAVEAVRLALPGAVSAPAVEPSEIRLADYDVLVAIGANGGTAGVRPAGSDARALLATAGDLWSRGAALDRSHLDAGTRRVTLPTYPFQRRRFWVTDPPPPTLSIPRWVDAPAPTAPATGSVTVLTATSAGPVAAATAMKAAPRAGHLLVVTSDLQANPDHAIWAGLAMALADENPGLGVRVVDLSPADTEDDRRAAVERESTHPPAPGPARIVAWRNGRRLVREFVPAPATGPVDLPPDGRYLIAGGAGAVGAAIARHLAGRGRPRLVLAGRSAEPAGLLEELRDLGATASYRVADVTVPDDVAALVAGDSFDVVVQAAGVVRPGSLRAKTAQEIADGFAAKVRGTYLLAEAVREQRPLFVALSSVSSVLPGLAGAVGDYVAGNAYLDAFAAAERAAGRRFVAVNLPALSGGMATAHATSGGGEVLPIDQVPEILWAAAALEAAQVLVGAPQRGSDPPAAPVRVSGTAGAGAGYDELVAIVRELLAEPLDREPGTIGPDEPFLALGLDSLTAVDLVKELESRLGRTLSTTLFFEHRTIGELAGHLAGAPEFPLSPVQRAFHTTGRLYPGVPAYAYVRQTVTAPVDPDRLATAFAELERRHPMLRVRIGPDGQRFEAPGPAAWFTVTDLTGPIEELDAELRNRTFDLTRESPVRAVLAVAGPELAHLMLVVHHAAADGYSLAVLGDELWALYAGAGLPAPPRATFADHETARAAPAGTDLEYWRAALSGYPTLALPFDGDPDGEPRAPYAVHQRKIEPELTARLTAQARAAGVSLFHLLLAGYVRCLARWSGQSAVPVAVARAGRAARLAGVDRMVGPFADTLPVLAQVSPGEPAVALADRLRQAWLVAEQHGSVSTVDIARMLAAHGAGPRTASPASFSFARFPSAGSAGQHTATYAATASAATRLGLVCFEAHGTLHFSWNYPEALFDAATVERFATEHLAELAALDGRAGGPPAIVERIRAQCHRTPAATAVLTDGVELSYLDLDLASERLAARLAETGARRIGLLTGPGADTVIGLVAVLKAGAAWVPLDAAHPPARLADQLRRAGAGVIVCDAGTRAAARALGGFTLVDGRTAPHATPPPVTTGPDDLAYVIFTSGSTGRPKGVPVTHRAMANYLDWSLEAFGYRGEDRLAQTASICFDASVRQLLAPLLVGATVVAWERDTVRDPDELLKRVVRDRVTVWSSVPTLWERLLGAAEKQRPDLALRWVHVGGEELSAAHVRRWFDLFGPGQRITNLYGPTETTINATYHLISERPGDDVTHLPIGRPVGGAVVEVVGEDGRECGPGEVGELYIGGAGVAAGYLDDPSAAFVERGGQRWYRSGDRAVRDTDGVLWFRGRVDDQVKLHGYRIEPGEVEAVLRRHPDVDRSAVRVDGNRLVAWVQPRGAAEPSGSSLRSYLGELLPPYLVPARIEVVAALPLTATGKVDRALLVPAAPAVAEPAVPPATATEQLLARVWSRQLGVPSPGRDDDYFALGGDSIGVLEMFAALEAELPVLPRPTVIYQHRTLAALAAAIDAARAEPAYADDDGSAFPLSLSQRGFLLADAIGTPSTWLAAPRLHGPVDLDRFQQAVDVLVARHPMLRTVFDPPTQRELPAGTRLVVEYDPDPGPLTDEMAAERAVVFDPARWPLVRMRLLRVGPDEHVLLMHAHHLIGDGYSVALLTRELLTVYDRGPEALTPLRSTFREYVALVGRLTPTPVPRDRTAGGFAVGAPVSTGFTLGPAAVAGLRALAAAAGVTPFVPVLTAYHRCLGRLTGRPDPTIGVAVTGRDHALPDLARIFGPCATAVAVRPGPPSTPADDLRRMADAVTAARTGVCTVPEGWQYFFTYLDFGALGPVSGETLRLSWDDTDTDLAALPGTDVLLAARPSGGGLRLTLRGNLPPDLMQRLSTSLRADLESAVPTDVDAALVGYLPAPAQLAALAPAEVRRALPDLDRETIRAILFPDGRPRLLETVTTPLGRSGFVSLPRFADELTHGDLAADAAAAVDLAAAHGARTVSLAGMIPAHTGYGAAVARHVRSSARVTTGHAVTAASVVRTTFAARGRDLSGSVLAVLGVGSIGTSSLCLLLARAEQPPAGLILCDLPATADRLAALAAAITAGGYPGPIEIATGGPDAVYRADVIVAATSGGPGTLDIDRLRPGTVLVDDSFPHCFDTARALARMRDRRDVLVAGGGLLDCGPTERSVAAGLPVAARPGLPDAVASCQLESLLHAVTPDLPLVCGPVSATDASAYWDALDAAGVAAARLHLLDTVVSPPA
ncbi:non-ribosomal peptide synthetase/type I polyketide synthase [Actinoplanes aureus]|nr:non-ribosomal peptide synthetase/type I polyketide synthase [Actinoplanes aureus]